MTLKSQFFLIIIMVLFSQSIFADTKDLFAGQHHKVGRITTEFKEDKLVIEFIVEDPYWCLQETHLYVNDIAPKKMAPGSFQYQHEKLDCVSYDVYEIANEFESDIYIAAHSVLSQFSIKVNSNNSSQINHYLVDFIGNQEASNSYFLAELGLTDITYPELASFCIDTEHQIRPNFIYTNCNSFSGLDQSAPVDKPHNLDLVNYLLNTDYSYLGATAKEIQAAVWELIDDYSILANELDNNFGAISWDPVIVKSIVEDAKKYGEGFYPDQTQWFGLISQCFDNNGNPVQVTINLLPMSGILVSRETAWAKGNLYPAKKKGWSSYYVIRQK